MLFVTVLNNAMVNWLRRCSSSAAESSRDHKEEIGTNVLVLRGSTSTAETEFIQTTMNFLRRRFSSGDLQGELKDRDENINVLNFKKGPSPSAPSSPSRSTSVSGMTHPGANKPPYNKDRCKILLVVDDQHTDWWVAPWQWLIYRKYWWCNRYQEWGLWGTLKEMFAKHH